MASHTHGTHAAQGTHLHAIELLSIRRGDEEGAALIALKPAVAAKVLVELVSTRIAVPLHDRHDRAARILCEKGPDLAVDAQREVRIGERDERVEA